MTKLFNKKTIVSLGAIVSILAPVGVVVSCGDDKNKETVVSRDFSKEYDFSGIWANMDASTYEDVTIKHWIDGDTLVFEHANGVEGHLRISEIDTPESHVKDDATGQWVDTTGIEKEWADKAFNFGKQEIPANTTARVMFQKGGTYGREVGSLFYGTGYKKSYSTNIMRSGLALPFIGGSLYMLMYGKNNPLHYVGIPMADAYNYAKNNKIGMFSVDPATISQVHGVTSSKPTEYKPNDKESMYNYTDVDFWKG